jgi:putative DNA primase/helicase
LPKAKSATMLDHALEYAKQGLSVIPLYNLLEDGTCACDQLQCTPGKHPRISEWQKKATTDAATIKRWWSPKRWPHASIGGVGGKFLCLDIDAKAGGFESLEELVLKNTELPDTATVETGLYGTERGMHYWFSVPEGYKPTTQVGIRTGIDIRCTGGYAVMPPSEHVTGVEYSWLGVLRIKDAAECPEWLLELVPEHVEGESSWSPDPNFHMSSEVRDFLNGKYEPDAQRDFLTRAARSVLTTGRDVETTARLLWEGTDGDGGICSCDWDDAWPWTEEEVYKIVSDVFRKPPTSKLETNFETDFSFDDTGNAQRLIASFPDGELHFVPELKCWQVWDGEDQRYYQDYDAAFMTRRWIDLTEELMRQALSGTKDADAAKSIWRHAKSSRARARLEAAVAVAQYEAHRVKEYELDADPYLLGVENGVVDLRDGSLRNEEPDDLITRRCTAEYDTNAKSKLLRGFLKRTIPVELMDYVQQACGYTLTGVTDEHVFFYVYGRPATGKTTFLEAFRTMMGTYAITAEATSFMRAGSRNPGGASEDLARLAGPRLVVTNEVDENERWAVPLVSRFTGGDWVSARFLNQGSFQFKPRFKLWIGANNMPQKPGGPRSGLHRRLKIIGLDNVVPPENRDPTLSRRLRDPEAQAALLAWAVSGAITWRERYEQGQPLEDPTAVAEAVHAYEREQNHVQIFAEEALDITENKKDRVLSAAMHEHYMKWCAAANRQNTLERVAFGRQLTDLGLTSKATNYEGSTKQCWHGVRLKATPSADAKIKIKGPRKR